jgi:hypothetical protein
MLLNKFKKIHTHRRFWGRNRIGLAKKYRRSSKDGNSFSITLARRYKVPETRLKIWPADAIGGTVAIN